ncbi:MAG: hypothetical protein K0M45_09155 [Candidatus Paracaedibacteraceae bacterium]|nr:hypothetical protein [Candidatus Paracaedibacteraceae bacterium]
MNTQVITGYYDHNKFFSVIGEDGRKKVAYPKTISHPWSTMCHIDAVFPGYGIAQGSGALIGDQFVLTAGHVVCDKALGGGASKIVVTLLSMPPPLLMSNLTANILLIKLKALTYGLRRKT